MRGAKHTYNISCKKQGVIHAIYPTKAGRHTRVPSYPTKWAAKHTDTSRKGVSPNTYFHTNIADPKGGVYVDLRHQCPDTPPTTKVEIVNDIL